MNDNATMDQIIPTWATTVILVSFDHVLNNRNFCPSLSQNFIESPRQVEAAITPPAKNYYASLGGVLLKAGKFGDMQFWRVS